MHCLNLPIKKVEQQLTGTTDIFVTHASCLKM